MEQRVLQAANERESWRDRRSGRWEREESTRMEAGATGTRDERVGRFLCAETEGARGKKEKRRGDSCIERETETASSFYRSSSIQPPRGATSSARHDRERLCWTGLVKHDLLTWGIVERQNRAAAGLWGLLLAMYAQVLYSWNAANSQKTANRSL